MKGPLVLRNPKRRNPGTPDTIFWWAQQDLNLRPSDYESPALTAELWAHSVFQLVAQPSRMRVLAASRRKDGTPGGTPAELAGEDACGYAASNALKRTSHELEACALRKP